MAFSTPEVLAPAGDMERFLAALRYGADAIYLGGKQHNMRASTRSFTVEELAQAVSLAHQQGVKVYFTCNTLPVNDEIPQLESYLAQIAQTSVDAFIVADIGVMMAARRAAPETAVHISTQAGVTNYLTAAELYRLGASRVVLARELSLEDIRCIRENTPPQLELECFVHGAMCMSFSGRCLLSDYFVGRSANRGECAQPCRWSYYLMEEKRPGQYFPVFEDERGSYILNAKDLCLIESLDQLCRAGVSSLKIEGRAKSAYYVAVVTNAYRNAVDLYQKDPDHYQLPQWLLEETRKVSHRDYSTGFLYGRPGEAQCYQSGGYIRQWDVVAVVERWEKGRLYCVQRNRFYEGDRLEALIPRGKPVELTARDLRGESGDSIACTNHAAAPFSMAWESPLPEGTILRAPKEEASSKD